MIVVGVDPGATVGWCELQLDRDARTRANYALWRAHGEVRWKLPKRLPKRPLASSDRAELLFALENADLVAIEEVAGYPFGKGNFKRSAALIEAAKVGQEIASIAQLQLGARVVQLTAGVARRAAVGRNNADDPTIKRAVKRLIRDVPNVTNAHNRDAAIVALVAGWMHRGG